MFTFTASYFGLNASLRVFLVTLAITLLSGCGDDQSAGGAKSTQDDKESRSKPKLQSIALDSVDELPSCDDANDKQLAYIIDTEVFYSCDDGQWVEVEIKGKDGKDGAQGVAGSDAPTAPVLGSNEWQDPITGDIWLMAVVGNFAAAQAACSGSYRMPTREEGIAARLHGLNTYATSFGTEASFWTSKVWGDLMVSVISPAGEVAFAQSASKSAFCLKVQ